MILPRGYVSSLVFALAAFLGFGLQSGFGQSGRASITGTVTEQTGAVVPDAKVVVTDAVTGQAREVVTTESGTYVVPLLPVGSFSVTCSHPGFKSETRIGIKLTADQKATVDFSLSVGEVTQTIEVSAGAEAINTTNGAIGQVVEQTAIVELPLNGRNPAELVFLAPGAVDGFKFGGFTRQEFTTFPTETAASVNGGRQGSTYYMLDGANNMDNYHNNATPFPNSDATQEFRVLTNNFDAQYGFSPGAVVSIVTRSGGKDWHGDAFEFIRNDKFNARDFFARDRDTLKRNQFGASAGGSIIKDKLFIFGNYQGTTERRRVNGGSSFVPSNKMIAGDFSDLLAAGIQIKDATTGLDVPGNVYTPTEWATKLNPVANNFLDVLPRTDDPSGLVSLSGAVRIRDYHEFTIKPDWYVSTNHHISGRMFFDNFTHPKEGGGGNILLADRSWTARYQNYGGNWLYTIRPNLIHNLVVSYNRLNTYSIPGFETKDGGAVCFKCMGVKVEEYPTTAPNLMLVTNAFWATQNTNYINRNNISISDSVSWTKGKHLIVAGVDVLRQSWDLGTDWLADPIFQFDGQQTNSWFSDFLTGKASMFWQGAGSFDLIKGTSWSGYAQDTIRLKPNLTLGVGLRWEPYYPYEVSKGRIPVFKPGQQSTRYPNAPVGLVYPGDEGIPSKGVPNSANNFSPRMSIAWQPKALPNTSIRAAFGFFIAPLAMSTYNHVADTAPFAPSYQVLSTDPLVGKPVPFEDPWSVFAPTGGVTPFPPFSSTDYAPGPEAPFVRPVFVQEHFSQDFHIGKVQSWNFSIEHELKNNILLRAAYVGSEGYHLPNIVERNPGFYSANGARALYQPDFTNILQYVSWTTASYNALQLTFDKRFSGGLQFTSNYAYSKNIDSGSPGAGVFSGQLPNPFNAGFNRGLSDLNHPHIWTNFWVYQLPSLKQQNAFVRGVLGDWQFSGTWRLQSGDPFSVGGGNGNNSSLAQVGGDRADLTGQPITSHQGDKSDWLLHYMNLSAFAPNGPGTFGNSPRNVLRGDMTNVADLGISKNFPFKERYRIQFRWEMFNAFNRPHFSNPSNNPADPSSFGRITSTKGYGAGAGGAEQDVFGIPARIMQFALKFHW
jgi:hypothetical protein